MAKQIKYWELYVDGEFLGYLDQAELTIKYGYIIAFGGENKEQVIGVKEASVYRWEVRPVYEESTAP